jgi:hypothetical protein
MRVNKSSSCIQGDLQGEENRTVHPTLDSFFRKPKTSGTTSINLCQTKLLPKYTITRALLSEFIKALEMLDFDKMLM